MTITIDTPSEVEIAEMRSWPTWAKEVSVFDWTYDVPETCYLLAGEVVVTTADGASVRFAAGDRVRFPQGLSCVWDVRVPVRKHYRMG